MYLKNAEGYRDETAWRAIIAVAREECALFADRIREAIAGDKDHEPLPN